MMRARPIAFVASAAFVIATYGSVHAANVTVEPIAGNATCAHPSGPATGANADAPTYVTVYTSKHRPIAEVATDASGAFTIPMRFDGRYTVVARHAGCEHVERAGVRPGENVVLALEPWVFRHERIRARSLCGAFQGNEPIVRYTVGSGCGLPEKP